MAALITLYVCDARLLSDIPTYGLVADLDDTTPGEPGHPARAPIIESRDDLARMVMPNDV